MEILKYVCNKFCKYIEININICYVKNNLLLNIMEISRCFKLYWYLWTKRAFNNFQKMWKLGETTNEKI